MTILKAAGLVWLATALPAIALVVTVARLEAGRQLDARLDVLAAEVGAAATILGDRVQQVDAAVTRIAVAVQPLDPGRCEAALMPWSSRFFAVRAAIAILDRDRRVACGDARVADPSEHRPTDAAGGTDRELRLLPGHAGGAQVLALSRPAGTALVVATLPLDPLTAGDTTSVMSVERNGPKDDARRAWHDGDTLVASSPIIDDFRLVVSTVDTAASRALWARPLSWGLVMLAILLPGLAILLAAVRRRILGPLRALERGITDAAVAPPFTERLPAELRQVAATVAAREAAWREAAAQRRLQVQEVYHRVANTLQMVVSLLRLEPEAGWARGPDTDDAARLLREAQDRVTTIATVHHSIRSIETHGPGDIRELLWSIADRLVTAFGHADDIELDVYVQPTRLTTDETVALALLVNEWVTACLHGRAAASGTLHLRLRTTDGGRNRELHLARDFDGPGPPGELHLSNEIMEGLAAQLQGRLSYPAQSATTVLVTFPTIQEP